MTSTTKPKTYRKGKPIFRINLNTAFVQTDAVFIWSFMRPNCEWFTAYQLNDESCEPDFIEVICRRPARCEVTEEAYIMPAGLAKFGCYKFGKPRRTIVRVSKPLAYLEG